MHELPSVLTRGTKAKSDVRRPGRVGLVEGRVVPAVVAPLESELTRARLDVLNARTDARFTRANLEHAMSAAGER